MPILVALLAGLVFGTGLTVSEMVNPAKVLGFLDFAGMARGSWDPSLALVMGAALLVTAPAFYLAQQRRAALLGSLRLPTRTELDARLVGGALLFGIGWGLVGFCPGPAVAALGFGSLKALIFVGAMIAGMGLYEITAAPQSGRASPADQAV